MASTIGTGQDYTTITAWEAALGGGGADDEGQCIDEAFDETFTVNAGTSPKLTHTTGAGHDSTEGSGARIVWTTDRAKIDWARSNSIFEHIEVDGGGNGSTSIEFVELDGIPTTGQRLLIHDCTKSAILYAVKIPRGKLHNSFVYNMTITATNAHNLYGIQMSGNDAVDSDCHNNTVFNLTNDNGSGNCFGINAYDNANCAIKNTVITDCGGTTSGTKSCFNGDGASTDAATNASDDSTAPSAIATEPVASSTEFVSTGDPPDLRLKSGAECEDTGTDIGTSPTGVEVDILGRNRDTEGDTWDVGAHEFVSGGSTVQGAASLTGTGDVAAAAVYTAGGAAVVGGTGSLAPTGSATIVAAAALTGTGTVGATGGAKRAGAAALTGTGTLAAAGTIKTGAFAALTGTGTIAAAGTKTAGGSASLTGTGTIAAAGHRIVRGAASLNATGTISATATTTGVVQGAASLTGTGTITARISGQYVSIGKKFIFRSHEWKDSQYAP